jgi:hypothetical protein
MIGSGMEKVVLPSGERTKALLTPRDKDLKMFTKADYRKIKDSVTRTGKYNLTDIIHDKQQVFQWKPLEKVRKTNSAVLEWEDNLFSREAYQDSFAQYMKADDYTL